MKEASGELNMTVITVVAIAAIGALLWAFWPNISSMIESSFNTTSEGACEAKNGTWNESNKTCTETTVSTN